MEGTPPLDCTTARDQLRDLRRGRLPAELRDAVFRHLRACAGCRREDEQEALLDRLLVERLPRPEAPADLRRRVTSMCEEPEQPSVAARAGAGLLRAGRSVRASRSRVGLALAALVLAVMGGVLLNGARSRRDRDRSDAITSEAVGDHLRVVTALHPYDVESDDSHSVKPWFEGRLDFAPNVPAEAGTMKLRGGSVGFFLGRKAAVISYALRKHAVTMLAFPADGLDWPATNLRLGGIPVRASTQRGIHVVLWKHGDLGYAAVADVGRDEFLRVAAQLAAETAPAPEAPSRPRT